MHSIANTAGIRALHIGVMAPDGAYSSVDFTAESTNAPLVEVNIPNRQISCISIETHATVYLRGETPRRMIHVFFQRKRAREKSYTRMFTWNPLAGPGISSASVQRAKRALKAFAQAK